MFVFEFEFGGKRVAVGLELTLNCLKFGSLSLDCLPHNDIVQDLIEIADH